MVASLLKNILDNLLLFYEREHLTFKPPVLIRTFSASHKNGKWEWFFQVLLVTYKNIPNWPSKLVIYLVFAFNRKTDLNWSPLKTIVVIIYNIYVVNTNC